MCNILYNSLYFFFFIVENYFCYYNLLKMEDSENEFFIVKEWIEGKLIRVG